MMMMVVEIGIEHVNDYTLIRFEIRIVNADSIRDSIRMKISDSQVPTKYGSHSTETQFVRTVAQCYVELNCQIEASAYYCSTSAAKFSAVP